MQEMKKPKRPSFYDPKPKKEIVYLHRIETANAGEFKKRWDEINPPNHAYVQFDEYDQGCELSWHEEKSDEVYKNELLAWKQREKDYKMQIVQYEQDHIKYEELKKDQKILNLRKKLEELEGSQS